MSRASELAACVWLGACTWERYESTTPNKKATHGCGRHTHVGGGGALNYLRTIPADKVAEMQAVWDVAKEHL